MLDCDNVVVCDCGDKGAVALCPATLLDILAPPFVNLDIPVAAIPAICAAAPTLTIAALLAPKATATGYAGLGTPGGNTGGIACVLAIIWPIEADALDTTFAISSPFCIANITFAILSFSPAIAPRTSNPDNKSCSLLACNCSVSSRLSCSNILFLSSYPFFLSTSFSSASLFLSNRAFLLSNSSLSYLAFISAIFILFSSSILWKSKLPACINIAFLDSNSSSAFKMSCSLCVSVDLNASICTFWAADSLSFLAFILSSSSFSLCLCSSAFFLAASSKTFFLLDSLS
jgi:hypothetical protein